VVTNEKEGLAAIDAYLKLFNGRPKTVPPSTEKEDEKAKPELILTGRELTSFPGKSAESDSLLLEDHLFVTQGTGNLGGDVIHRLTLDSEFYGIPPELRNPEVSYPSMVPIMWEWPDNHSFAGGNVLYLDGHVEFVPYPGNFPMTKNFIEALRKVEPQLPDGVPPIVNK
jgi:prepilin-type processing-associated H-X9-DG protein